MGRIISVINDKGGVSKTTTVMNLATALWLYGKKVLLVDNDPQCNLTFDADKTSIKEKINLYSWMLDKKSQVPVFERYNGLDYIPSSPNLGRLEKELSSVAGSDRQLSIRLEALRGAYDFILIDCAPGCNSLLNLNALEASDELIVPIRSDVFSVSGRELLRNKIMEIRDLGNKLTVAGVLLTQFNKQKEMARSVREHFRNTKDSDDDVAMPLFPIEIRMCEDVNKAHGTQMSIYEYNSNATAADDYMRLAENILGIYPRKKSWVPSAWSKKSNEAYNEFINNQNA